MDQAAIPRGNPLYLDHLELDQVSVKSVDGKHIEFYTLQLSADEQVLSDWANRFRENYRSANDIEEDHKDMGLSKREYLLSHVFPSSRSKLGPSVRAGDFAELLVSDFLQYQHKFYVPRLKYASKANPDESVKGVDVLGLLAPDPSEPNPHDQLVMFEVKAKLSNTPEPKAGALQKAIDDSSQDFLRLAYTLNGTKQKYRQKGEEKIARIVARFQNVADRPYELWFGAAAVYTNEVIDYGAIGESSTTAHRHRDALKLLVIRGDDLMNFVHGLYQRAADEA